MDKLFIIDLNSKQLKILNLNIFLQFILNSNPIESQQYTCAEVFKFKITSEQKRLEKKGGYISEKKTIKKRPAC